MKIVNGKPRVFGPLDRLVDRSERYERMMVERPHRVFGRTLAEFVMFVAVLIGFFALPDLHGIWGIAVTGLLSLWIGMHGIAGFQRMAAYRNGFFDGRRQMVSSLTEAGKRGMSMEDWLEAEMMRQMALLGLFPADEESE